MTDNIPPEGVHTDQDGTARIVIDGTVINLRRPTLSEYGDIIDKSLDVDYAIMATRDKLKAINAKAVDSKPLTAAEIKEAKRINRYVQTARGEVVEFIISHLGDAKTTPDLPPWAAAGAKQIVDGLFAHWETVPFHGSGLNES